MGLRGPKKKFEESYYTRNKEKVLQRYQDNREDKINYQLSYYARNRIKVLIQGAKQRAAQKGLEFDLTEEWAVVPENCPVLGTPMGPSTIDRRDNSKGYTQDNCFFVSKRANRLKSDMTIEECEAILRYMKS